MEEKRYRYENGKIWEDPPLDGCTGCGLVLVTPIVILLFLKLLSKIPVIGEIFDLLYELIVNLSKMIFIEFPLDFAKLFFERFPATKNIIILIVVIILVAIIRHIVIKIRDMN